MTEPFIYRLLPALGSQWRSLSGAQSPAGYYIKGDPRGGTVIPQNPWQRTQDDRTPGGNPPPGREKHLPGSDAFELFDTYGFPVDLTQLILRENRMTLDEEAFRNELNAQKERSRDDAAVSADDWVVIRETESTIFTGYDRTEDQVRIARYRKVTSRGRQDCSACV
jgi:hypothetical protein